MVRTLSMALDMTRLPCGPEPGSRRGVVMRASVFRECDQLARAAQAAQLLERLGLDLPNALARDAEGLADLLERVLVHAADAEAHAQDPLLARGELRQRLDDVLAQRRRLDGGVRI